MKDRQKYLQEEKEIKVKKVGWLRSIFYFLQGNIRYAILLRQRKQKWSFISLPQHIVEQFEFRKKVALKECVTQGECVICECKTPELFLADKACAGRCYPRMKNKKEWNKIKNEIQYGTGS